MNKETRIAVLASLSGSRRKHKSEQLTEQEREEIREYERTLGERLRKQYKLKVKPELDRIIHQEISNIS